MSQRKRYLGFSRPVKVRNPTDPRDLKFCERWLIHHDPVKAYQEAGFFGRGGAVARAARKLAMFHAYLERLQPKVDTQVAKKISYERTDILRSIALIANSNALDYIKVVAGKFEMKPISELTRDQAAALDRVVLDPETGRMGYSLPAAKTRLAALTALGEQAAGFKKPDTVHNHLHLTDIPLDKVRHLKQMLIEAVGQDQARLVFGMTEEDQQSA